MMRFLATAVLAVAAVCAAQSGPAASTPASLPGSQPASFRVAAIQAMSDFGKSEANARHLADLVRKAAAGGAQVVVLPETAITGYADYDLKTVWQLDGMQVSPGLTGQSPKDSAEPADGPRVAQLLKLAGELKIYLTVPFVEVDAKSGRYFNTIILAGPDGKPLLHYRKLNPWPYAEKGWTTPGDRGEQYVDTPFGRLGLLVCYDINFEPPRLKAAKVDTLLYCIAWVDKANSTWFTKSLPAIAAKNDLNIVGANWTVPTQPAWIGYGHSLIIDRTGKTLAAVKSDLAEEIIYADLPVAK